MLENSSAEELGRNIIGSVKTEKKRQHETAYNNTLLTYVKTEGNKIKTFFGCQKRIINALSISQSRDP